MLFCADLGHKNSLSSYGCHDGQLPISVALKFKDEGLGEVGQRTDRSNHSRPKAKC